MNCQSPLGETERRGLEQGADFAEGVTDKAVQSNPCGGRLVFERDLDRILTHTAASSMPRGEPSSNRQILTTEAMFSAVRAKRLLARRTRCTKGCTASKYRARSSGTSSLPARGIPAAVARLVGMASGEIMSSSATKYS